MVCILHACTAKAIARFPVEMDFSDNDTRSDTAPTAEPDDYML